LHFTDSLRSIPYQRLVAPGSTMVVTFDLPPPRPPDNLGGVPLQSIQEGQVYIGTLVSPSALQGVAIEGKISHNGCGTMIGRRDRMTKTMKTKQHKTTQELSSGVNQLQRMASDQAELLKKIYKNQEKQDQCAQRAARKAEKTANAMMSMMRAYMKSQSTGRHKNNKFFANKSSKGNNSNASPTITFSDHQSEKRLCKNHQGPKALKKTFLTEVHSQNNTDNNNETVKNIITKGCSMNQSDEKSFATMPSPTTTILQTAPTTMYRTPANIPHLERTPLKFSMTEMTSPKVST
jgi:hypothetical protein